MSPPVIDQLVERLRSEGKCSPVGPAWAGYYRKLKALGRGGLTPPVPFILAAAGEAASAKLRRLRDELLWAQDQGCLQEAIQALLLVPEDEWETHSMEGWSKQSYWSP